MLQEKLKPSENELKKDEKIYTISIYYIYYKEGSERIKLLIFFL
jgi:hypothetical protein